MIKTKQLNKRATYPKTYYITNKKEYFEFLIKKSEFKTEKVLFYPNKEQLKNIDKYEIIVLYEFQKEEEEIVSSKFRKAELNYYDYELLEFLEINSSPKQIKELAKTKDFSRTIYVFMNLWQKYNLNPAWIKDLDEHNIHSSTFLDLNELSKEYKSIKKYKEITNKYLAYTIIMLLYSELSGEITTEYEFFTNAKINNPKNIKPEELKSFNIDKLMRAGIIYKPKEEHYAIID